MSEELQVIEINGVKLEVDMRHAKRIDHLVVGSKVKVLTKSTYGEPKVYPGVVVGFEPFKEMPTIIVCYLEHSYNSASLEFAYVNTKSADKYEIVASIDDDLPVDKADVLTRMDRELEKKREEIDDLLRKRGYFLAHFNKYFESA